MSVHEQQAQTLRSLSHVDDEYEIGALASRNGISIHQAREIVERCGCDMDCIDQEASKLKRLNA